jgi:hypothetical protein
LTVHALCTLVLLVQVGWVQGTDLGNGESKVIEGGLFEYVAERTYSAFGVNF